MNLAIGDLHGKNCWEDVDFNKYEDIYFLGDYFDSFTISFEDQFKNLEFLIKFARKNKKVHLCLGNHDFIYLSNVSLWERSSGFQENHYVAINSILQDNIDLLKFVYKKNIWLISHAGISQVWLSSNGLSVSNIKNWSNNYKNFYFNGLDSSGNDKTQSCIWIRPQALLCSKVKDYKQIVGHTPIKDIFTQDDITFCDCLDYQTKFFEFE